MYLYHHSHCARCKTYCFFRLACTMHFVRPKSKDSGRYSYHDIVITHRHNTSCICLRERTQRGKLKGESVNQIEEIITKTTHTTAKERVRENTGKSLCVVTTIRMHGTHARQSRACAGAHTHTHTHTANNHIERLAELGLWDDSG